MADETARSANRRKPLIKYRWLATCVTAALGVASAGAREADVIHFYTERLASRPRGRQTTRWRKVYPTILAENRAVIERLASLPCSFP